MTEERPAGWALARLETLVPENAPIIYGILQPGPDQAKGIPYARPTEIVQDEIQVAHLRRTTPAIAKRYARSSLEPQDVLLSIVGTIGKVAIVPTELAGGNITQSSARIRTRRAVSQPDYVAWALRSPQLRTQYDSKLLGTGVPRLNVAHVRELEIPLPPLNEQRRIVAKIDALTAKSRRAKKALDAIPPLLDKLRQSILAAAFRGDLTADWRAAHPNVEPASKLLDRIRTERRRRWEEAEFAKLKAKGKVPANDSWKAKYQEPEPVDETGLPELPEGWCWAALEQLTDSVRLIRYGMLMPGPHEPSGMPYVKVLHMRGDVIDTANLPRTTPEMSRQFAGAILRDGDLLVSIRGTYGRVAVVPPEADGANITQDSARVAPLSEVHVEFLAGVLRSNIAQGFFNAVAKGVAVRGINIADLRRTPIPLAPEQEQDVVAESAKRASAVMGPLLSMVRDAENSCSLLEGSILAKAFRGELVPQDPNDEPASVLLERIRTESGVQPKQNSRRRKVKTA